VSLTYVFDHGIAYIRLRDMNPNYIRALMAPNAMTIPANIEHGSMVQPARSGPVFSTHSDGSLHMRYTACTHSIEGTPMLLSPSSTESESWRIHVEHSTNQGDSWKRVVPINHSGDLAAIQPSILTHAEGILQLMCRTRHKRIAESWSSDGGKTWSELQLTSLKNPNSGTDAVSLADGRQLLVYNRSSRKRTPLVVALSHDGKNWRDSLVLARGFGKFSYPAVIQTDDGLVHITYSWNLSRIRHVVIDPEKLRCKFREQPA